jgi:hypothetical protein
MTVSVSSANTDGITVGASMGIAITANTIAEWDMRETGTVYHLRLPTEIDGRVTSPNRSRGMNHSPSALSACPAGVSVLLSD